MPVMVTASSLAGSVEAGADAAAAGAGACCARPGIAAPISRRATADAMGVLRIFMCLPL
jgi:hypothetical protein